MNKEIFKHLATIWFNLYSMEMNQKVKSVDGDTSLPLIDTAKSITSKLTVSLNTKDCKKALRECKSLYDCLIQLDEDDYKADACLCLCQIMENL